MSLQRWNPFEEMLRLEEEINRIFGNVIGPKDLIPSEKTYSPLTDLQETGDTLIIHTNLPGIRKEDLSIEATPEGVEIRAETKNEKTTKDAKTHYKERFARKYTRIIRFPSVVKPKEAQVTMNDGVLTITFPKAEKTKKVKLIPT